MFDIRPVGYVTGMMIAVLGVMMVIPMGVDMFYGDPHWKSFVVSGVLTLVSGISLALSCANAVRDKLTIQQSFLMAAAVWLFLPMFGATPFYFGDPSATPADAFFEAMSGLTTTGATVFTELETLPRGTLLWRSMLQWFGGIGIIVVAMAFLPALRVGGMQIFRSESFDTGGKVLPRAAEIATQISVIYLGLTAANVLAYLAAGLPTFDAINHALTTISTGGFSTYDASFGQFQGPAEYVATGFMLLASLPFVQLVAGQAKPLFRDSQIRVYLATLCVIVALMTAYRVIANEEFVEESLREALFNVTSIISGTGYASTDYQLWGSFAVVAFFFIGLIGGCAGSTSCSVKIFRYQLLFAAIRIQVRKIHAPHGVFDPRYEGRPVSQDVLYSVMSFFVAFFALIGGVSVLLALTGEDMITSISGAAAAVANIGPGLGAKIGPAGTYADLEESAKWVLSMAMLIGRLELMVVLVLLTPWFWRS